MNKQDFIKFNVPFCNKGESEYIAKGLDSKIFEGGEYSEKCKHLIQKITGAKYVLLTSSCTAALEMSAILADVQPGDEVIMPSFTFVSTANAFILRGAKPVFVDICPDTLNLDPSAIEKAISEKTKAIVPMHYSGVSCQMEEILALAKKNGLFVIEDAAQALLANYNNEHLGTIGDLGTISFHYTKNIIAGFGGALLVNNESLLKRAKVLLHRGTNREAFLEGQVDKYTWVDIGSSFIMGEQSAALLFSQLEKAQEITQARQLVWKKYHEAFEELELQGLVQRPGTIQGASHNAHNYYLILNQKKSRTVFIEKMYEKGIQVTFHYQPLHQSQFYIEKFGAQTLPVTEAKASSMVRFPIYPSLTAKEQNYIIEKTYRFFNLKCKAMRVKGDLLCQNSMKI
ncbi:MAG: dTDP-4-amino-4,6-dideoxygalactose transaminase [Chlamydiae bacterium]|nr:dTDP-4-amino-4,6-dideoxygalactose transaminase [Chlamydiota bacterium]